MLSMACYSPGTLCLLRDVKWQEGNPKGVSHSTLLGIEEDFSLYIVVLKIRATGRGGIKNNLPEGKKEVGLNLGLKPRTYTV